MFGENPTFSLVLKSLFLLAGVHSVPAQSLHTARVLGNLGSWRELRKEEGRKIWEEEKNEKKDAVQGVH